MLEFYDIFGIELHFFTVEFHKFILIDVSYKRHPHWQVVEAIYDSSCAPVLSKPMLKMIFYIQMVVLLQIVPDGLVELKTNFYKSSCDMLKCGRILLSSPGLLLLPNPKPQPQPGKFCYAYGISAVHCTDNFLNSTYTARSIKNFMAL